MPVETVCDDIRPTSDEPFCPGKSFGGIKHGLIGRFPLNVQIDHDGVPKATDIGNGPGEEFCVGDNVMALHQAINIGCFDQ